MVDKSLGGQEGHDFGLGVLGVIFTTVQLALSYWPTVPVGQGREQSLGVVLLHQGGGNLEGQTGDLFGRGPSSETFSPDRNDVDQVTDYPTRFLVFCGDVTMRHTMPGGLWVHVDGLKCHRCGQHQNSSDGFDLAMTD